MFLFLIIPQGKTCFSYTNPNSSHSKHISRGIKTYAICELKCSSNCYYLIICVTGTHIVLFRFTTDKGRHISEEKHSHYSIHSIEIHHHISSIVFFVYIVCFHITKMCILNGILLLINIFEIIAIGQIR